MANCPKCGRKLHIYDWRAECPECHVNMVYYQANEKLLAETEKTEIEHAKFQPKVDRAKAATIGTRAGIIRMVLFLIPIAALFLPLCKVTVSGAGKNINAIEVYNIFSSADFGGLIKNPALFFALFLAIPAVCCIVFTIMQIASCSKKGLKRNIVLSSVSIFMVLASIISFCVFSAKPAENYTDIVLNEANTAVKKGGQAEVDSAVQKLRNLYKDETVDTVILENAIKDGEKTLDESSEYGLTKDEVKILKENIKSGKDVLADSQMSIDAVRDSASAINTANYTYSALQTAIYAANNSAVENEEGIYSDKCYKDLCAETEKAKTYLQNSFDRIKVLENNGEFSENSYNGLQETIILVQECLDTLNKGEPVVELLDDDGSGNKTDKELALETAEFIQTKFNELNTSILGLTDISSVTPLIEKVSADFKTGALAENVGENVSSSLGIGVFVFLALYIVQLVYNILLNKKGIDVKYTVCLIGGLPSDEYFDMVDKGVSELEIRKKMVEALTKMQDEVRQKAAEEEAAALKKAMERK